MRPPDFEHEIYNSLNALRQSGLLFHPGISSWGISCDALNPEAVAKLLAIQHPFVDRSVRVLMNHPKQILKHIPNPPPDLTEFLNALDFSPIILFPEAVGLPDEVRNKQGNIAICLSSNSLCKSIIQRLKSPLLYRSVNQDVVNLPEKVAADLPFLSEIDYQVYWPNWVAEKKTGAYQMLKNGQLETIEGLAFV